MAVRICLLWVVLASCGIAKAEQYAFLVGVKDYSLNNELTPLKYSENDVHELASTLFRSGVPADNITLMTQRMAAIKKSRYIPTANQIRKELTTVLSELRRGDTIIVGFSGHGLQFKDDPVNYYCPSDARLDDKSTLISLSAVYQSLERCPATSKLLLVDACRNDPVNDIRKAAKLIQLEPIHDRSRPVLEGGTVAIFSCSASEFSFEHPDLENGLFFHFINCAFAGEADVDRNHQIDLFELENFAVKNVQKWARVNLGEKQTPERSGRVRGTMTLAAIGTKVKSESYMNSLGMTMQAIPAGTFLMGSRVAADEIARRFNGELATYRVEHPQHRVSISKPFLMSTKEVTVGQFRQFVEETRYRTEPERDGGGFGFDHKTGEYMQDPKYTWKNPGFQQTARHPVVNVTWNDAMTFCDWISQKEGRRYTLPTEAQWEYACRAGSTTLYHSGNDPESLARVGNVADATATFPSWQTIDANDGHLTTAPVASYQANKFGLFDMHGNAAEWCLDWFDETYYQNSSSTDPQGPATGKMRVYRGGGWNTWPRGTRSATRDANLARNRGNNRGFRVVTAIE